MPHGRGNRDTFKCDGGCYYDKAMKKKVGAGRDRTNTLDSAAKCKPTKATAVQAQKIPKDGEKCPICRKTIKVRPLQTSNPGVPPCEPLYIAKH